MAPAVDGRGFRPAWESTPVQAATGEARASQLMRFSSARSP
jgi:hypothetical protein